MCSYNRLLSTDPLLKGPARGDLLAGRLVHLAPRRDDALLDRLRLLIRCLKIQDIVIK